MELHVNRRVREKAIVFGLPAEHFMLCVAIMTAPILLIIFLPIAIVGWIPWMYGTYQLFRNMDSLMRIFLYAKQYPAHLKNR